MSDLLLEIGCEELPANACREAITQVPRLVASALEQERLFASGDVSVWVAPRRIAVFIAGLPPEREGRRVEVRGPATQAAFDADGKATKAAQGFARGQGVTVDALEIREDQGRPFVYAIREEPAVPVVELVPGILEGILTGLRFGKNMRWGAGTGLRFSRPVRWLVAVLDSTPVVCELFGLRSGPETQGHRFLGASARVTTADAYRDVLRQQSVIADHDERRASITRDLDAAAAEHGLRWEDPGRKLEEVLFLVESPNVIVGDIDPAHLRLPEQVLITAMQSHQRYFPARNPDGTLAPKFFAVSNGDPRHAGVIAAGNAGVLEARLQDAAFSWDRDREAGLEALDARLDAIVFHAKLGSMAHKRDRLQAMSGAIAREAGLDETRVVQATRAGQLAKVDQGAVLVAEFSNLQGYVGSEYAAGEGEPPAVAGAVRDHYLPEGPGSPLPESDVGCAVALAEKIDNLVGGFLAGDIPTSSKDPYALRRAATGVVRVLLDRNWPIDMRRLFDTAAEMFDRQGADTDPNRSGVFDQLEAFIVDRLAYQLREEGIGAEPVAAAVSADLGNISDTADWARQISGHANSPLFWEAWTAATRLGRIAAKAPSGTDTADISDLNDPGERALVDAADAAAVGIDRARRAGNFDRALSAAAPLAKAVDQFFNDVLVNDEDPEVRARRYAVVQRASDVLGTVAGFASITHSHDAVPQNEGVTQ